MEALRGFKSGKYRVLVQWVAIPMDGGEPRYVGRVDTLAVPR